MRLLWSLIRLGMFALFLCCMTYFVIKILQANGPYSFLEWAMIAYSWVWVIYWIWGWVRSNNAGVEDDEQEEGREDENENK